MQILRLRDVIGARSWRTAFFTTYSLSLSFFEAIVLHALRQAGVRTTSIAVDLDGYRPTLGERGAADAGRTYDLVPMMVPHPGIFHPKLMVLDGDAGPRIVCAPDRGTRTKLKISKDASRVVQSDQP